MSKREPNEEAIRQIADGATLLPHSISRMNDIMCGCGSTPTVWTWVTGYLSRLHDAKDDGSVVFMDPQNAGEWLLLYAVDYSHMTEHGVGIRGAWISEDGEEALKFLLSNGPDWQSNGFYVDHDGVCCGRP